MVVYVRGCGGTMEHRYQWDVKVEAKTTDTMPRMQGGAHSGVYDSTMGANAWYGAINLLEQVAGQSDRTPAPRV